MPGCPSNTQMAGYKNIECLWSWKSDSRSSEKQNLRVLPSPTQALKTRETHSDSMKSRRVSHGRSLSRMDDSISVLAQAPTNIGELVRSNGSRALKGFGTPRL